MTTVAARGELERLLADDVPYGDLTTEALAIGAAAGAIGIGLRLRRAAHKVFGCAFRRI
jgi:molybdenum transport protein